MTASGHQALLLLAKKAGFSSKKFSQVEKKNLKLIRPTLSCQTTFNTPLKHGLDMKTNDFDLIVDI